MTRDRANLGLAAILTTALATSSTSSPMPLGPVYMALCAKMNLTYDEWMTLIDVLTSSKAAKVTSETLVLTAKGRKLAEQVEAAMAPKAATS